MEILEYGTKYNKKKIFFCTNCCCKFRAGTAEYREAYTTTSHPVYSYSVATCPECFSSAKELKYFVDILKLNPTDRYHF